ncbi:protein of unknown function DUF881 [Syntrophobotulus glycolicus DSM 8271]|uniref:Division initiation protein n=1 Tax=Syntrophobotulus glycolicus (strain DSM 8271 / FlGlyR) TaxID=645991 RepID=F0SW98_SYNGF|nr:DUF881 domain-containing protein [Syntrophobotulus glycolicus]ADY54584.1 protein of unknown function DUF881 [Syntrophobotulus glycolicus DSM 8271]
MRLKNNTGLKIISIVALLTGLFLSLVIKVYYQQQDKNTAQEAAIPSLMQLEIENEQLAKENQKLTEQLHKIESGQNTRQWDDAMMNAGLVALKGPGIKITLDDAKNQSDPQGFNVIHEEYLRELINILWNGGAEAIAVNDQRVTSHTEIFCSGSYIQINGTRQMPPYIITAIGNQSNLQSALNFYGWDKLGEYQQQYGITRKLDVPPVEAVTVPAGILYRYQFAQAAKES